MLYVIIALGTMTITLPVISALRKCQKESFNIKPKPIGYLILKA